MKRKKYKNIRGEQIKMNINKFQDVNFIKLLNQKQIGPDGGSKEWLKLAQSQELMNILEKSGSSEYIKELKKRFAKKGFYKALMK